MGDCDVDCDCDVETETTTKHAVEPNNLSKENVLEVDIGIGVCSYTTVNGVHYKTYR